MGKRLKQVSRPALKVRSGVATSNDGAETGVEAPTKRARLHLERVSLGGKDAIDHLHRTGPPPTIDRGSHGEELDVGMVGEERSVLADLGLLNTFYGCSGEKSIRLRLIFEQEVRYSLKTD